MPTTAHLHAEADEAAAAGHFERALRLVTRVLAAAPDDHRARVKAALCLAALGDRRAGADALFEVARALVARGFSLAAIAAAKDGLRLFPDHPEADSTLRSLYARLAPPAEGARTRVPPPIAPVPVEEAADEGLMDARPAAKALLKTLPRPGEAPEELAPTPFFAEIDEAAFVALVPRLGSKKLDAGATFIEQGQPGTSLFVVVSGEVEVSRRTDDAPAVAMARLGAGHLVGELSLLTRKPRTASVWTVRPTELLEVDRAAIEAVAAEHPSFLDDLLRFARRRLLANLFATSPLFRALEAPARRGLLERFETRTAKAGEVLIAEGQPTAGLFLVFEGEVEVTATDASGDRVVLAYLREGQVVGEIALLEGGLTTATVTATERAVLLHLPRARFEEAAKAHPELDAYLKRLAAERLAETEDVTHADAERADELVLI